MSQVSQKGASPEDGLVRNDQPERQSAVPHPRENLSVDKLLHRAGSGHRRYPRAVLRRIAFLVFAQRVGLTLDEIAEELAKLPQDHAPEGEDWARLSSGWTSRIDARIAQLERMRGGLIKCIGCGCLSLEHCRFANPGDRAARLGPGPRYWIVDSCEETKPVRDGAARRR